MVFGCNADKESGSDRHGSDQAGERMLLHCPYGCERLLLIGGYLVIDRPLTCSMLNDQTNCCHSLQCMTLCFESSASFSLNLPWLDKGGQVPLGNLGGSNISSSIRCGGCHFSNSGLPELNYLILLDWILSTSIPDELVS